MDLSGLSAIDAVHAYALASECPAERGDDARAVANLQQAVARSDRFDVTSKDPAFRVVVIAGNDIAVSYEAWPVLNEVQRERLITAAHLGRMYGRRSGTRLEIKRAQYRLSKSMLIAGYAPLAIRHAQRCIRICEDNGAPALELFFGVEALALALARDGQTRSLPPLQEKARALFDRLEVKDKAWCACTLNSILSLVAQPETSAQPAIPAYPTRSGSEKLRRRYVLVPTAQSGRKVSLIGGA